MRSGATYVVRRCPDRLMVRCGIRRIGSVLTGDVELQGAQDVDEDPVMPVDYFTQSASRCLVGVEPSC